MKKTTNWKSFAVDLHNKITNPNLKIKIIVELETAVDHFISTIQNNQSKNTKYLPPQSLINQLPNYIRFEINRKRRLRRAWQHTHDSDAERRYNNQIAKLKTILEKHKENKWHSFLSQWKHNDPRIFKINKGLINKKSLTHPLIGNQGLV